MRIRREKITDDSLDEYVETNRISDIEISAENRRGSSRKMIYILLFSTIALLTILIIVNLIYKKPGKFIETTKSKLMDEILSGSGSKKTVEIGNNAILKKAIDDYQKGYTANAITGLNSVVESRNNFV